MEKNLAANARNDKAIRYLLGKMSEQEESQFEAQYFADNDLFEEMIGLENDLLESYARGDLTGAEREQFERGYLNSAAGRKNLRFAKAFAGHLSQAEVRAPSVAPNRAPERSPFPRVSAWPTPAAFAAVALIILFSISWMAVVNSRLHHQIDQMRAQQAGLQVQETELRQQLAVLSAQLRDKASGAGQAEQLANVRPPGPDIIALALTPGMDRSSRPKKLVVSPATLLVQLQLYLEHDDYPSYSASVETAEDAQLWKKNGLKTHPGSEGGRVTLGIPAAILQGNVYLVRLTGVAADGKVEDVGDYHFLVVHARQ